MPAGSYTAGRRPDEGAKGGGLGCGVLSALGALSVLAAGVASVL